MGEVAEEVEGTEARNIVMLDKIVLDLFGNAYNTMKTPTDIGLCQ